MDTVILKIYGPNRFQIKHLAWYVPELTHRTFEQISASERSSKQPYLRRFVFHPPRQDRYRPRVEIFEALTKDRKGLRYVLKLEFSVPKLLYGNSILEVGEEDKEQIIKRLQSALMDAGIKIEEAVIASASVSGAHFCKNILLPRTIQLTEILHALLKVDISKAVDVTDTKFKQGGKAMSIYSGTIERSFYDKISDSMRPKNKRKDKAKISRERVFAEQMGLENSEMFRYEYRIKKAQTVRREVNKVLGREPLTSVLFADLFTPGLFKNIVLKSWRDLIERPSNQLALLSPVDKLSLFLHILSGSLKDGKAHGLNKGLIAYGLTSVIGDHGAKEVKQAVSRLCHKDHPERLTKKIEEASRLAKGLPYSSAITHVDGHLERFERITRLYLGSAVQ